MLWKLALSIIFILTFFGSFIALQSNYGPISVLVIYAGGFAMFKCMRLEQNYASKNK